MLVVYAVVLAELKVTKPGESSLTSLIVELLVERVGFLKHSLVATYSQWLSHSVAILVNFIKHEFQAFNLDTK